MKRRMLYVCPNCGTNKILRTYMIARWINVNTGDIESEELQSQWLEEPEYNCSDCGEHFNEPERIVAFVDDTTNNVIYREDQYEKGSTEEKAFKLLADFERELRLFIKKVMNEKFGERWWERVPHDIKVEANKRRKIPESPLIDYLNFSDYPKIILKKDNWRELYKKYFKQKDRVNVWLQEINEIRSSIAHSRKISEIELKTLELDIDKLLQIARAT